MFQYIKRQDVKIAAVPQIEGLTVEDFLQYAKEKDNLLKFFPDEKDWLHLDKSWICNILFSLDTNGIQKLIDDAKENRKKKLEQSQDLIVNMRPEFVDALQHSLSFSNQKGRSVFLLKDSSKQKRKRNEIEEVKSEEESLKKDKQEYLREVKRLKRDNQELESQILQLGRANDVFQNLVQNGIIDQNGVPIYEEFQENSQSQVFQI